MNACIIYYSRTGKSRRVAERLAGEWGVPAVEIIPSGRFGGIFGYLKAGYLASGWRKVDYRFSGEIVADESTWLVLVSPVWAGRCAAPVYSALEALPPLRRTLVLVHDGSDPEKVYCRMEGRYGLFERKYSMTKARGNAESVIGRILAEARE